MLLRSSSTPVLGSLLSSISESPNNNYHIDPNTVNKHLPTSIHHNHKFSYYQTGSVNLSSASCNSSPISPSISELGFRRAQSDGNLEGLAYASCNNNDGHYISRPQKLSGRMKCSMLQTIPSSSYHGSRGMCEDEEEESDEEEEESDVLLDRCAESEEKIMALGGGEFNWEMNKNIGFVKEKGLMGEFCNVSYGEEKEMVSTEMYLARGLGVNGGDIGGFGSGCGGRGGDFTQGDFGKDGDDGDKLGMEEYYKTMVKGDPGNPLFLRNYAQFLYQSKKDLPRAEEYYSRAILADPKDGDILSQYARLIWELHHDEDRASNYFERAVQASPEDSHVLAAYANFMWATEDDEEEDNATKDLSALSSLLHQTMASA